MLERLEKDKNIGYDANADRADRAAEDDQGRRRLQDLHLLVRQDIGGVHQLGVDRDRALVVQVRLGDRGAMDLRLERGQAHARTASLAAAKLRSGAAAGTAAARTFCGTGTFAGSITAALFLSKFIGDHPWVHLDIASTDWSERERAYIPKGPTGIGTRLLIQYLIDRTL